jgi:hypothetical protein
MSEQVRYITNEQGERVSVLLDLEAYNRLANPLALDEECLIGLSRDELQALADSKLAPAAQNQLNDMLARNAESQLSADEIANLDRLLAQVDQLTILKTRARYTLNHKHEGAEVGSDCPRGTSKADLRLAAFD